MNDCYVLMKTQDGNEYVRLKKNSPGYGYE